MKTIDFDYQLPQQLIAQTPVKQRDQSRLMVVDRRDNSIKHHQFFEVTDYIQSGDVMVFNNSQVIPSRLHGRRVDSSHMVEILLLRHLAPNIWEALVKCKSWVGIGTQIEIMNDPMTIGDGNYRIVAEVTGLIKEGGKRIISFPDEVTPTELGEIPLPPYIRTPLEDSRKYQTVYASIEGSVAAPTAGLHFTKGLIDKIKGKGVQCLFITLHIGLDTFRPVRVADVDRHPIHQEYGILGPKVATRLSQAKRDGRRIICVGTSTTRLLEAVAQVRNPFCLEPFKGWVSLFIRPGHNFKMVDGLITNFHLPRSTLLMLVTAFAGRDVINKAYSEAITQNYRFYSFGDAMFIL